ncbi:MAG: shikimate kinase [Nitrospiraceae bacterium]|jgi:shikimate kinase
MNIVLIGYRGTGKSTVGKILAKRLGLELVSTDTEVVKRANLSIPELVQRHGWEYFRDMESTVCRDLAERNQVIIDTGGGAILRPGNVDVLRKTGRLYWLTAGVETISKRIEHDTQRPSLTGGKSFIEEIREVLAERTSAYQAAADCTIETDGLTVSQVAETILRMLSSCSC